MHFRSKCQKRKTLKISIFLKENHYFLKVRHRKKHPTGSAILLKTHRHKRNQEKAGEGKDKQWKSRESQRTPEGPFKRKCQTHQKTEARESKGWQENKRKSKGNKNKTRENWREHFRRGSLRSPLGQAKTK